MDGDRVPDPLTAYGQPRWPRRAADATPTRWPGHEPTGPATVDRIEASQATLLSRRGLQVALGWLWLIDAALQAQPSNFSRGVPLGVLAQSAMGAPLWENRLIFDGLRPFAAHWPLFNLGAVVIEASIGLSLVRGRRVRPALGVSVLWSLVVWVLGEGMGMVPTGFAMMFFGAPGAALLLAVLAVLAWPAAGRSEVGARRWSVVFGFLWAGAALLQIAFVYPAGQTLRADFAESSSGQASWLVSLSNQVTRGALDHPAAFGVMLATMQLAVAVGCLADRSRRRSWLVAGVILSCSYWVVGQSLGSVLTGRATDVGTAPLVVVLCLAGWPRQTPRPETESAPGAVSKCEHLGARTDALSTPASVRS